MTSDNPNFGWLISQQAMMWSVVAEIEAMKAENIKRDRRGESLAYGENAFFDKASELHGIAGNIQRNT